MDSKRIILLIVLFTGLLMVVSYASSALVTFGLANPVVAGFAVPVIPGVMLAFIWEYWAKKRVPD